VAAAHSLHSAIQRSVNDLLQMYADNLRHTSAIVNEIFQHLTEFHTEFLLLTAQMFPFHLLQS